MVLAMECVAVEMVVFVDTHRVKPSHGQDIRDRTSDMVVVVSMVGVVEGEVLINVVVVLAGHTGSLTTEWHTEISNNTLLHIKTWGREGLHSGTRGQ
jgi:nitrous oxidase accessory protein NosD